MSIFRAAAIQLNSQPDLMQNMEKIEGYVEQAVREQAGFIALPENFAFLGSEKEKHRQAEAISDIVMERIPQWASQYGITILAGGFPVRAPGGKVYNRAMVVGPAGEIQGRYDKIHLFDISLSEQESYRESDLVEAGSPQQAVICETQIGLLEGHNLSETTPPSHHNTGEETHSGRNSGDDNSVIRFGLSICYDVRFPELYRRLTDQQADILCIPSAFTRPTGEAHWEVLLRARAIENTAYVIAPAQTGIHGKRRKTHGHSMIIDPWGRVLADAGREPGILTAEIDPGYLRNIRQKLPSLQHRKL